jgi:hypothetical protein
VQFYKYKDDNNDDDGGGRNSAYDKQELQIFCFIVLFKSIPTNVRHTTVKLK